MSGDLSLPAQEFYSQICLSAQQSVRSDFQSRYGAGQHPVAADGSEEDGWVERGWEETTGNERKAIAQMLK